MKSLLRFIASPRSPKRSTFTKTLAASALALTTSGCIILHDSNDTPQNDPTVHVDTVDIDVSAGELTTDPGAGVSIIVEYAGQGRWNVFFTCDSEKNGYACHFDLYTRSSGIRVLEDHDLEGSDYVEAYGDQLHAAFDTDYDVDGFTFDTPLGEPVEIEAYIDGDSANHDIFWIGGDVLHEGAPTNPTLFLPPSGA